VSAWRNFKNIFSRPLFTIIFRPEMLKFYTYSILTGERNCRICHILCVNYFSIQDPMVNGTDENKDESTTSVPVPGRVCYF
jgi:hypothetical protein